MSQLFKIANIEVKRGEKKSGYLKVAERSITSIDLPITIINGIKPGPILCVIAGEHPNEYAGIETCIRLAKNIDPKELSGVLIIIPIINLPGFQSRTPYVCPLDGVNISMAWPGKLTSSSITYVMAYHIFHDVIVKSNYLIRLHGGDICESMIPCVYFCKSGNQKLDEASKGMAKVFGIEYIIETPPPKKGESGGLTREAVQRGISTITPEAGSHGRLDEEDISILYDGVTNVMKHLGMLPGKPKVIVSPKIIGGNGRLAYVSSERGGLFYSMVEAGDIVSKGDIIGEIRNIRGETIEKIPAPIKGKIFFKVNPLPWDPSLGWFLFYIVDIEP